MMSPRPGSVSNQITDRSNNYQMNDVQKAVAQKMLSKMTGVSDTKNAKDIQDLKNRMYQPIKVQLSAGQDVFRYPLRQGVTYSNDLGLKMEGTAPQGANSNSLKE